MIASAGGGKHFSIRRPRRMDPPLRPDLRVFCRRSSPGSYQAAAISRANFPTCGVETAIPCKTEIISQNARPTASRYEPDSSSSPVFPPLQFCAPGPIGQKQWKSIWSGVGKWGHDVGSLRKEQSSRSRKFHLCNNLDILTLTGCACPPGVEGGAWRWRCLDVVHPCKALVCEMDGFFVLQT